MRKLTPMKLILTGIILYMPCFAWQFFTEFAADAVPGWFILCSAIPAGICLIAGLIWMRFKKESSLDDSLQETMRERNTYR